MADIFDEIRDDMKQERFEKLLRKYWIHVASIGAMAILIAASFSIYNNSMDNKRMEAGDKYNIAIEKSSVNKETGIELLTILEKQSPAGYRELATIAKAKLLVKNGELDKAIKLYDSIYVNPKFDIAMKEMAFLLATHILVENPKLIGNKEEATKTITERLDLLIDGGSVWAYSAYELKGLYQLEINQPQNAIAIFEDISKKEDAPRGMKYRMQRMIEIIKNG